MREGWGIAQLGQLCRVRTGKKDVNQGNPQGKYPFFTCAAEHTYSDSFSFDTEALLIAGNGNVGQVSYYNGKFEAYQRTYVVSDFKRVLPRYLYLILDGKLKETVSKQKLGNTMPYIKVGMLTGFQVPVPPLPEQQRIVALLDDAFDGIATAKANAEQNLKNARELFESHLQSVFTQRGEGWVETRLDELCEVKDGTHESPRYVDDGIPFVTQKNIRIDGLSFANTKFIDKEDHAKFYKRSNVACGDIIISMIGANRGMSCIVDDNRTFSIKNVGLVKASDRINTRFLLYFLKSPLAVSYVSSKSKGGAQEFIGLTELRKLPVVFPKSGQQVALVAELDQLYAASRCLESIYQQKLAALDELKKSLLHKAFNGEL